MCYKQVMGYSLGWVVSITGLFQSKRWPLAKYLVWVTPVPIAVSEVSLRVIPSFVLMPSRCKFPLSWCRVPSSWCVRARRAIRLLSHVSRVPCYSVPHFSRETFQIGSGRAAVSCMRVLVMCARGVTDVVIKSLSAFAMIFFVFFGCLRRFPSFAHAVQYHHVH